MTYDDRTPANIYSVDKKPYKPYQLVFDPTPKQKWHKELKALVPPIGHELDCPIEFAQFPYAAYEWLRIMELDKDHKVITPVKREMFYGYCLMVERRKVCMLEWDGGDGYKAWFDRRKSKAFAKMDYLVYEIQRLNKDIDLVANKLGLYKLEADDDRDKEKDDTEGEGEYIPPDDDSDLFD